MLLAACLTDLVRQFVAEHSYRRAEAARDAAGEGRSYRQAVAEVVNPVPQDHHPGDGSNGTGHLPVAVAVSVVTVALTFVR